MSNAELRQELYPNTPRNPNHDLMANPYEDLCAAAVMLTAVLDLIEGHPEEQGLTAILGRLNKERIQLLGGGTSTPQCLMSLQEMHAQGIKIEPST